ncbi:DUF559 domain-containing protein [Ornithinibacillus halotolerans]|uniref:DUF559 domain-containing protein n=1 Tax=Ornithinibacillus halotolerans TaxID=1274357 RepID=A0A916RVV5_9BACI|nr:DUF559 domain-containing protein [Ornithinibacillus halotolerans]GGA69493.1 hypothetical protein GCM10008025_11800 [Ornithinibacillus halotolerans]
MLNNIKTLIYQPEGRDTSVEVKIADETVWMTQKAIAALYQTTPQNITIHLKNISRILDLLQDTKYYIVQNKEGTRKVKRKVLHYNLDTVFNIAIRGQYFEEFNNLINFAQTNGVKKEFLVFVPIKERRFGEMLKNSLEGIVDIYDQYKVDNYIVDFYIPQLELVIEYDEKHHKEQIKDDKIRQEYIEEKLGVQFIRVNEGKELQGLNQVIKLLLKNEH